MKKRTFYLIIGILFISFAASGQTKEEKEKAFFEGRVIETNEMNFFSPKNSQTSVDMARTIRLEDDSNAEDIFIEIKEKTQKLQLEISCSVKGGKLTIELYDPNGIKQGNFTIETQLKSEKEEKVNGNISKSIIEPQFGKWWVKIIPIEVTGDVKINTAIIE